MLFVPDMPATHGKLDLPYVTFPVLYELGHAHVYCVLEYLASRGEREWIIYNLETNDM